MPLDFDRHFENCYRWINDPEVNEWLAGNDLSRRMQEKSGYKRYGVRPQAIWKRGEHRDMVLIYLPRGLGSVAVGNCLVERG